MWRQMTLRKGILLEYFALTWLTVEIVVSIYAGFIAGSFALLAFGGDSLIELVSALVVLQHLRKDSEGFDVNTEKVEKFVSILLFLLIPVIGIGALYSYSIGLRAEASPLGIAIAIGAVIIMPYLWLEKKKIGRDTQCYPLITDAAESATCFFMSVALLGGLLAEFFLGLWWVDYVATVLILAFVAKEAINSWRKK